jgi:hypothetical protein
MLNIAALLVALKADVHAENLETAMEEDEEDVECTGLTPRDYAFGDEKVNNTLDTLIEAL